MAAFVGYLIDDIGKAVPIAAGTDYNEVFMKTFGRLSPFVSQFHAPGMSVQEKDITPDEAADLERICADHLGATP